MNLFLQNNMSFKSKDEKDKQDIKVTEEHTDEHEKSVRKTQPIQEHDDKIAPIIESPIKNQKSGVASKSNLDNSFSRNKFSERDLGLENSRNQRQMSGFEDANIVDQKKKRSSRIVQKQDKPTHHQSVREQVVFSSRNRQNQLNTSSVQKCPSWLKTLLILIGIVAFGGSAYWFFFKKGKTAPVIANKINKDTKTQITQLKPVTNTTLTVAPVILNKTATQQVKADGQITKTITQTVGTNTTSPKQLIKNETQIITAKQQKPSNDVSSTLITPIPVKISEQPKNVNETSILVPNGNRTYCPDSQFLLNGNCLKCPEGMTWFGLNCVEKIGAKHLRRIQG